MIYSKQQSLTEKKITVKHLIGSKIQTTQRKNFCARLEEVTQKNTRKHSGALCIAFSAKKKQLLNSANQSRTT